MKKILLTMTTAILLASFTFISSCAKDGATGPAGPTGANGPTGSTGATGPGAFALQGIAQPNGWIHVGTSGTAGAFVYAQFNSSHLAYDSVKNGAVLVYERNITNLGAHDLLALPNISYYSGIEYTEQYNWNDGALVVDQFKSDYTFTSYSAPDTFVIVVIPGTGKTSWPVDLSNYNAVMTYFKPRLVN